jgi:hypothetical protein
MSVIVAEQRNGWVKVFVANRTETGHFGCGIESHVLELALWHAILLRVAAKSE